MKLELRDKDGKWLRTAQYLECIDAEKVTRDKADKLSLREDK